MINSLSFSEEFNIPKDWTDKMIKEIEDGSCSLIDILMDRRFFNFASKEEAKQYLLKMVKVL